MSFVESRDDVPGYLISAVPGFKGSEEYLEWKEGDLAEAPAIAGGAFADFLVRTIERRGDVGMIFLAIEYLASSSSSEVQNFVVVDFFEALTCSKGTQSRIEKGFLPNTRGLLKRFDLIGRHR